jgi:4-amino-4-deoxy-L-arabinose transferase-like glycosyltransferase
MTRPALRLVVVGLVAVTVLGFNFGARGLLTNDDTRFPVLARDVLVNGHWLLPALPDGTPHLIKPPLVVWLIALASWPGGAVTVRTATLPSLLAAIAVVVLTCWIGRRLFDPDAGVVAALTALTTVGMSSMAHSAMPDMVQLCAMTAAMAAYVAWELGGPRAWLVGFYALIGVASLTKGAAGFLPLAIVLVFVLATFDAGRLRRLVSVPGITALALLAIPWWIVAALAGRNRFVHGVVFNDQLLWYFERTAWSWRTLTEPFAHAVAITLPWCLLLPVAVRRAVRETDPETARRLRLVLAWLVTSFVLMAVSGQQRERYYLPLCPAVALMIGWWYSTLGWRRRAVAFACAWMVVVAVGVVLVVAETRRFNARSDLGALRGAVAQVPAPVYAADVPELVLAFNLDRPVLISDYRFFEERAQHELSGYLVVSDRMLRRVSDISCMRRVATGMTPGRPFTVVVRDTCASAPHEETGAARLR